MNYLDILPEEILYEIAKDSEPTYKALLAYPRFARAITPGTRLDYMVLFGHNIHVYNHATVWLRNCHTHRIDGPARITTVGGVEWYQNGELHRDGGPAMEYSSGAKFWYQNGEKHRDNGPAATFPDGSEEWYQHGKRHRDGAPAVIYGCDNVSYWYQHGILHRNDGPAVSDNTGDEDWYFNGVLRSGDVRKFPMTITFSYYW